MTRTIAIIDDDPDFRSAVRIVLETASYACVEASTMREGLDLVARVAPDLIVLDVMMEDISSGFRFAKQLREQEAFAADGHTPILVVTSVQNLTRLHFEDRKGTHLLPVDTFLNKPVQPEVLLKQVNDLIEKKLRKPQ